MTYIDDTHASCNDPYLMMAFKAQLGAMFKIKDLGDLSLMLGMHITRDMTARTISMDQSKYVKDISWSSATCRTANLHHYRWTPASPVSHTWITPLLK
jgi:hypothetical protein